MILLLKFDRGACRIADSRRYEDAERDRAVRERLAWEIDAARSGLDHEVVLLEADTEEDIQKTHGRYFESSKQLSARLERSARK